MEKKQYHKHERNTSVRERELRELRMDREKVKVFPAGERRGPVAETFLLCGKGVVEWEGNGREGGEWRRREGRKGEGGKGEGGKEEGGKEEGGKGEGGKGEGEERREGE
eukprot:CAMPEP_0181302682 /NCGR_PEP_ID=MMETSP1101-20121128/8132_1 /TAXON_ID=46948 /ORGANISM="Rhodomonas abbreviata, Strain Caron Lab Isolate" /LENGTH=108 /DNA_ID=CAMNT_0023408159 /DNA_START=807 /DNA_END=1131 /DNA_ORIENTATION=+